MIFLDIERTVKVRLRSSQENFNQRHRQERSIEANVIQDECEDEKCASTQFLQMQKYQSFDLQEHLERYCNFLQVFGFNSAKYDPKLIKIYLLPILIKNKRQRTYCYQEYQSVHIFQVWWFSAFGYNDFSWRSDEYWFILESLQNLRVQR